MNQKVKDLAAFLNGREYGEVITKMEEESARANGLVVLFGYSDDNAEFRGAINDEVGCYGGGTILVNKHGVLTDDHDCDCRFCGFKAIKAASREIEAIWDKDGYSWTYRTEIPHATFDIMEDGQKFCRGIVFSMDDLMEPTVKGYPAEVVENRTLNIYARTLNWSTLNRGFSPAKPLDAGEVQKLIRLLGACPLLRDSIHWPAHGRAAKTLDSVSDSGAALASGSLRSPFEVDEVLPAVSTRQVAGRAAVH